MMRSLARYFYALLSIVSVMILISFIANQSEHKSQRKILLEQSNELNKTIIQEYHSSKPLVTDFKDKINPKTTDLTNKNSKRNSRPVHLNDIIASSKRISQYNFNDCDMSTCFDFSLCQSNALKVHIVPAKKSIEQLSNINGESNIIHKNILEIIRASKYYEADFSKACIFIPEHDTLDRDPLSTSFRQYDLDLFKRENRFGMNYLIFNLYSGTWPDYREDDFTGLQIGAAILAKASNSLSYHREGFDISIPLFSYQHQVRTIDNINFELSHSSLDVDQELKKKYLISFKGKRYVFGSGSETRNSLYHLHNKKDVIMLTTCRHGKKWRDIDDARCLEEGTYDQLDFVELMQNSTFCLTPRGRRLGSFRFLEALNYTCIPVVLSDGWVWPFGEIIDWSDAAIQYREDEIFLVPDSLKDYSPSQIKAMQSKSSILYHKYFSSIEKIVMSTLNIIERRIIEFSKHNFRM